MQTIFEAAVECYENHISIVPSLNKRPTLKTWKPYQKNRAPIEQLEKWFAGDNPPNISMVLGWVSGIWGIDADNEEAVEWVENHLPCNLSETRVALTSRGRHYYFRIPPNITIKSSNLKQPLGLAIEFKGEGNMLVMPPSIRADGFQYTWLFAPPWCDIPKVDVSYFEKFLLPPPPKLPKKKKVESTEETEAPAGRKVDLTSLKTPVNFEPASAGERNDKLYRQLCKLVEPSNLKPEDIREFGHILNRQFSPPLENEECENIIKSALKYFKTGEEKEQKDSYHNLDNIKSRYLYPVDVSNTPNEPQWILEDSLLKGHIGMIFGPPGAGKGLFTASLIVSLASGFPLFDHWRPTRPFRVMAISVEDDLDILHRRLHQAQRHISEEIVSKMEYKVGSYQGKVSLTEFQKGKSVPTEFYDVFSDHVQEYNPDVLILDTLARFIEGDENNNNLMNGMFELMELLGKRISCNVILVHHSAKRAGDVIKKQKDLDTSLSQTSVRGASSMAGALRWILQLVPIGASMVKDLLGDGEPPQGEDGTHVLAKVVKKNEGPPESFIILEKGAGKLSRLHSQAESFKEDQIENMVQKLVEEIEALAKDGTEVPASYPENVLQWSKTFLHEAVNRAIERGLITKVHNVGKNGYHLEVVK